MSKDVVSTQNESNKIVPFFKRAASASCDYYVSVTQRCSNLLELKKNDIANNFCFLTENGLLVETENIVRKYIEQGRFPSIAFIGDVLVHGQSLNSIINTFRDEAMNCCRQMKANFDEKQFIADFKKAISLWIYKVNDFAILLEQSYQWCLNYDEICNEFVWRKWCYACSDELRNSDTIANTSYVISAIADESELKNSADISDNWELLDTSLIRYRDYSQNFYVHKVSHEFAMFPTVRSYRQGVKRFFVPYFFTTGFSHTQARAVWEEVLSYLRSQQFRFLLPLQTLVDRCWNTSSLSSVYGQFIHLILSQITLSVFLKNHGFCPDDFRYDVSKVARNFGNIENMENALAELCRVEWADDFLRTICVTANFKAANYSSAFTPSQKIADAVEDRVYHMAVMHERQALEKAAPKVAGRRRLSDADLPKAMSDETGTKRLESFIRELFLNISAGNYSHADVMAVLSCLTQMMDCGDVSLRVSFVNEAFYTSVCCTEMSLSIVPRKLGVFFESLYRVMRLYWRDDDFVGLVEHYFREILPANNPMAVEYAELAIGYARLMQENRIALHTMINWRFLNG